MEKNLLRQWREEKKVTGKQVAKAVGLSTVMISLYENFRYVPSKERAVDLVKYYFPDDDICSICNRVNDLLAHLRANFVGRPDYINDKYRPSSNELPRYVYLRNTSKLLDNIYGKVSLSDFQLIEELVKLNEK